MARRWAFESDSPWPNTPLGRFGVASFLSVALFAAHSFAAAPTRTPGASCTNCATIEAVLTPDGHVDSAQVVRSAGADFDRKALAVVKARRYAVPTNNTQKLHLTITVWPDEIRELERLSPQRRSNVATR